MSYEERYVELLEAALLEYVERFGLSETASIALATPYLLASESKDKNAGDDPGK